MPCDSCGAWGLRSAKAFFVAMVLLILTGCGEDLAREVGRMGAGTLSSGESNRSSSRPTKSVIVPFSEQTEYSPRPTELQYSLEPGSALTYTVETNVRMSDGTEAIYRGSIEYTALHDNPAHVLAEADSEEESEGTGTGFVVHPDGYLVTCAHVVEGATKLDVTLGDKTYPAKVVDIETNHDLALIRIDAHGLTPLPLMDSNEVQLAEEVRVIGFPLSDVLGSSLKVNRGIVSGIDTDRTDRGFQIDAQINPGNSGGPVVTEKGHVAGVASSLLSGEGLSNVGFAVPANQVRQMLERQPIAFVQADSEEPYLRGPELAQRVTPSVAFLEVTVGPDGVGIAENRSVRFKAGLKAHERRRGSLYQTGAPWRNDEGYLLTDPFGSLSFNDGDVHLPGYIGLLSTVGLEHMPGSDQQEWERMEVRLVPQARETQVVVPDDSFPMPGLIPNTRFGRFGRTRVETIKSYDVHPALEHSSYRIASRRGNIIEIEKKYEMTTIHKDSDTPFMKHSGKATILFDKSKGCLTSVDYSGSFDLTIDGTTFNFPLTYTCQLKEQRAPRTSPPQTELASNSPSKTPSPSPAATSNTQPKPRVPQPPKDLPKVTGLSLLDLSE